MHNITCRKYKKYKGQNLCQDKPKLNDNISLYYRPTLVCYGMIFALNISVRILN